MRLCVFITSCPYRHKISGMVYLINQYMYSLKGLRLYSSITTKIWAEALEKQKNLTFTKPTFFSWHYSLKLDLNYLFFSFLAGCYFRQTRQMLGLKNPSEPQKSISVGAPKLVALSPYKRPQIHGFKLRTLSLFLDV